MGRRKLLSFHQRESVGGRGHRFSNSFVASVCANLKDLSMSAHETFGQKLLFFLHWKHCLCFSPSSNGVVERRRIRSEGERRELLRCRKRKEMGREGGGEERRYLPLFTIHPFSLSLFSRPHSIGIEYVQK